MSDNFSHSLKQSVKKETPSANYRPEADFLAGTIVGIQEGLADYNAGRVHPLIEVDTKLRAKYGIPRKN